MNEKIEHKNQNQPDVEHPPKYISDPEYISKVINHYILDDNKNQQSTNTSKPVVNSQHYNRQHVIDALSNMQLTYRPKFISGKSVNINTDEFKTTLLNNIAKLDNIAIPKTMNQIDNRTIDFVEMIFGAFLRDTNISSSIKDLLLLMQIPIIKIALLDNKFFNNEKHPARLTLNEIAHLGIGIEEKEIPLYKTIQYIIEQLLHDYKLKPDVFNIARMSLGRLSEIEKSKHNKTEKQTKHLIAIEYTKHLVLKELQFYTSNISIPNSLQPLILSYWSTLMFHRYIAFGKHSIEWREVVGILRLLVKSFQPIKTQDDWNALRSIYKGIVNSVNSCLSNSRQNKEKAFIATSNLNNYYFAKLTHSGFYNEKSKNTDDNDSYNVTDCLNNILVDEQEPSPVDIQAESSKNALEKMPAYIKQNAWFEVFTDYTHPVRRLKLSLIMEQDARLIFVDYVGNKVLEKDLQTFIVELQNNQSRLINDHSIFEYALSMVIISIAAQNQ